MIERYVVHQSGAEILMADGESATEALARYERSAPEKLDSLEPVHLESADASPPSTILDRLGSLAKTTGRGLGDAFQSGRARWGGRRVLVIAIAAVTALIVGIVAINVVNSTIESNRISAELLEDQETAALLAEQKADADAKAEAELTDARRTAREYISEGESLEVSSALYATEDQKKRLAKSLEELRDALDQDVLVIVQLAIGRVRSIIGEIGTEDTPAQQAARQAEKEAAAAAEATAAAAAAAVAAEDSYVQAIVASGQTVDDSNRARIVESGRALCTSLLSNPDQSGPSLVTAIFNASSTIAPAQAVAAFCPQFNVVAAVAATVIRPGSFSVGANMVPGTYSTVNSGLRNCYWERSDSSGNIIDNNFITFARGVVTVTTYGGEGFTSSGCGLWFRL